MKMLLLLAARLGKLEYFSSYRMDDDSLAPSRAFLCSGHDGSELATDWDGHKVGLARPKLFQWSQAHTFSHVEMLQARGK